ncbi:MAG: AMP-binding protein [Promethearchaeota archaeon]
MNKKGIGKVTIRRSGKGKYNAWWIYIPSKLAKDSSFPFKNKEKVIIEILDGKLLISKRDELIDLVTNYNIKNATLPKLIELKAKENKDKTFLIYRNEKYSFRDLNINSNRIANGILKLLKELNLRKPKIFLMFPNCPDYLFTWIGISKTKSIFITLNENIESNILFHVLNDSDTEIIFIEYQYFKKFKDVFKKCPKIKKIIIRNAPDKFKFNNFLVDYNEIISDDDGNPNVNVKNYDIMEILYSGGTTGLPKGSLFIHLLSLIGYVFGKELEDLGFNESSRLYCPLFLSNGYVRLLAILPALFYNSSLIIKEKFEAQIFWEDIHKYKATIFIYMENILSELITQEQCEFEKKHSIKFAYGINFNKEIWEPFESRFEIPLHEIWAIAEGTGLTINKEGSKGGKINSIGRPVRGFIMKIVDKRGNELSYGKDNIGELVTKLSIPINFQYYKRGNIYDNKGWFHTGDYGYRDKDGFIYLLGGKDDIAVIGGRTIYLREIEKIANIHPFIIESAAITVPDNNNNDEIKICVRLKYENIIQHKNLYNYFRENLAFYMIPRYIEYKENFPKNQLGRIEKWVLKKEWNKKEVKLKTWDSKIKDFIKFG